LRNFVTYSGLKSFLEKNIESFFKVRRYLNKLFRINMNYLWDYFFPIYDYKSKLPLNDQQLKEWAILDTLDGLVTKYDFPKSYEEIENFLKQKNITIDKYNREFSAYKIIKK